MKNKKCIWCMKKESGNISFENEAHIVPQSLGAIRVCQNVCDLCNSYFGNKTTRLPSIDETLREVFILAQERLKSNLPKELRLNKQSKRFKSRYFTVDRDKRRVKIKKTMRYNKTFQNNLAFQFKRGIYKIFLEQQEYEFGDAHESKYNPVREFSRYGIGDPPVYYFYRKYGIWPMTNELAEKPYAESGWKYLYNSNTWAEYELLGHVFGFPLNRVYELNLVMDLKQSIKKKRDVFYAHKLVEKINDIDLLLSKTRY